MVIFKFKEEEKLGLGTPRREGRDPEGREKGGIVRRPLVRTQLFEFIRVAGRWRGRPDS